MYIYISMSHIEYQVKRILKWTKTASFSLGTILALGIAATFHRSFLWNTTNWPIIWFIMHGMRSLFSLSKVLLCRLPNNERSRKKKVGAVTTMTQRVRETFTSVASSGNNAILPSNAVTEDNK